MKFRQQFKSSIIKIAVSALTCVQAFAVQNPKASPSDVARQYLSAESLDAALVYLAPDYKLRFDRRPEGGMSKKAVARMLEWDFTLNPRHRIDDIQLEGQQVVARYHEDNDLSLLVGHPGWDVVATFTVSESGLITSQLYEPAPDQPDWHNLHTYLEPALSWLSQHHSDILAKIYPNNQLIRTGEAAREWVRILRDWKAATGQRDPTRK